jgi:nucleoside-diphosphate-sugar epimerase
MHERRRLLITGAAGFIGRHLVPALVGRGHRVVAVGRRPMTLGPSVDQVLIKDLADGVDWKPLLQGIDVVIHLAAIVHRGSDVAEGLYDKINRQATAALARATARAGARLIFVSSVGAQSAPSSDLVLTENDFCLPSGAYGRSKLNAEIDIAASGGQYVILRPVLVYGRGAKGNMRKLIRLARLPLPLPFGALTNKRSLLAIENLISAIGLLIQRDEIRNEVLLIADATPVSLPEIIARLRHGMGRPANLISIPPALLSDFFRMCRMSETWEKLAGNLVVSVARLNSTGYSPVIATAEGLAAMTGGDGGPGSYNIGLAVR